jgi:DNA-binding NarL/FixJ family response regulator
MARTRSCIAGNRASRIPLLTASLASSGYPDPVICPRINVTELGRSAPDLLVLDVDDIEVDPLELIRRTRFVLPGCTIVVYSGLLRQSWAKSCHLAGANCVLSKWSNAAQLVAGLSQALSSGSFTDPMFAQSLLTKKDDHLPILFSSSQRNRDYFQCNTLF